MFSLCILRINMPLLDRAALNLSFNQRGYIARDKFDEPR